MKPMGISARELSAQLGLPEIQIDELLRGARPITLDIAARLGRHFRMEPGFWVNLQAEYDRRVARRP